MYQKKKIEKKSSNGYVNEYFHKIFPSSLRISMHFL